MANKWAVKGKKKYYASQKRVNPFFNHPKARKELPAKYKMFFLLTAIILSGLSWLFFSSKFFLINTIEAVGQNSEIKQAIEAKAWEQTKTLRWHFFKQANLFAFDKDSFYKQLKDEYTFDQLDISRHFFHKLTIKFHEKNYSYVWKEADKYYYVDEAGQIIKEVDPLNIKINDQALIDNQGNPKISANNVNAEAARINYIKGLYSSLKTSAEAPILVERFIIDNDLHSVKLKTASSGPEILFNTETDPQSQLERLNVLINEKLKGDYQSKKYIDLRFGELIYYQ